MLQLCCQHSHADVGVSMVRQANQVIGRPLTDLELKPLTDVFGGTGRLTFGRFKSFLMEWAQRNATDGPGEESDDELDQAVEITELDQILQEPHSRQLLHRPSFVRDNSNTIISSEEGDPELIMAKRELRVLNILLHEARDEKLQLQAECDELRFDHDQLVMLTTTLRSRVMSLESTVQELRDKAQSKQLNLEIATQEVVAERLEKTRLQKEMRALQA